MDKFLAEVKTYFVMMREDFPLILAGTLTVLGAFTILIVGWTLARLISRGVRNPKFGGKRIDATLRPVLASTVFYLIAAMTVYAFLTKLGVPSAQLLAVFGAAGLAIGLALKDTLSNIASGVMMLSLRPLQVGDYVDTPNAVGTVHEIGLFATSIRNNEGVFLYIPNSQVWHSRVTNFGRHSERKLIVEIGVSYDADLNKTKELLLDVMRDNPISLQLPTPPECYVMSFGDSSMNLSCRCWMPAADWLRNASDMRIALKSALDEAGIDIPFPQRVVTTRTAT